MDNEILFPKGNGWDKTELEEDDFYTDGRGEYEAIDDFDEEDIDLDQIEEELSDDLEINLITDDDDDLIDDDGFDMSELDEDDKLYEDDFYLEDEEEEDDGYEDDYDI